MDTSKVSPTAFQRFIMQGRKGERYVYWKGHLVYDAYWGFGVDKNKARAMKSLARLGYEDRVLHLFQKRECGVMHYIAEHR